MGDDEFVGFVRARLALLRRAAYLLCGDWSRGDDILQRVLTDAYVQWHRVRGEQADAMALSVTPVGTPFDETQWTENPIR